MASTPKVMYRGAASTTLTTTLYTVPAATTAVVTSIVVANTDDTNPYVFTIYFDGTILFDAVSIGPNTTQVIDVKQVLATGDTIQGGADNVAINFSICGIEVA